MISLLGILLGLYLLTLIAFGYVGQVRLRASLLEQEQLAIEKQAGAIAYFLAAQQQAMRELGASPLLQRFFTDHDRRGPAQDPPAASRAAVRDRLRQLLGQAPDGGRTLYSRLMLLDGDGRVLLEAGGGQDRARYRVAGSRQGRHAANQPAC